MLKCLNHRKKNERDKHFKKFQKSCLHVDKDYYKEARIEVQEFIRAKKKAYLNVNWMRSLGSLKSYGRV